MTYTLIHHTGCGTSKKALEMLREKGIEPEVRKYMNKAERLSVAELKDIAKKMGGVSPHDFARAKDIERAELPADISDAKLFEAMAENPKLIQRPILIKGDKAVLGRRKEDLLQLVD